MSPAEKIAYPGMNSYQTSSSEDHADDATASKSASLNLTNKRAESQGQAQPFNSPSDTSSSGFEKHEDKDPFVSPATKQKSDQKLSATASAFQPFMFRMNAQNSEAAVQPYGFASTPSSTAYFQGISGLMPTSTNTTPVKASNSQMGSFSTDTRVTRALRVSGIYVPATIDQVEGCVKVSLLTKAFASDFVGMLH